MASRFVRTLAVYSTFVTAIALLLTSTSVVEARPAPPSLTQREPEEVAASKLVSRQDTSKLAATVSQLQAGVNANHSRRLTRRPGGPAAGRPRPDNQPVNNDANRVASEIQNPPIERVICTINDSVGQFCMILN
ncbi:hypothetical protein HK102_010731 [Quaeritorhiza haematococci]|nr:hypothetical protein HK102_010731 [Quaeritorhiza haematococci]